MLISIVARCDQYQATIIQLELIDNAFTFLNKIHIKLYLTSYLNMSLEILTQC